MIQNLRFSVLYSPSRKTMNEARPSSQPKMQRKSFTSVTPVNTGRVCGSRARCTNSSVTLFGSPRSKSESALSRSTGFSQDMRFCGGTAQRSPEQQQCNTIAKSKNNQGRKGVRRITIKSDFWCGVRRQTIDRTLAKDKTASPKSERTVAGHNQ